MSQNILERVTHSVNVKLNYVAHSTQPLYRYYSGEPPAGTPVSNEILEAHEVAIRNMRAFPAAIKLDKSGFELAKLDTEVTDIYNLEQRKTIYDAEVEALVKSITGAAEARVFNHFLRGDEAGRRDPNAVTYTAGIAHNDNTHESGPYWFDVILGADAQARKGRRFAIINVWRPITGPLQDRPLAICDARTTSPRDFMISESVSFIDENGIFSSKGQESRSDIYEVAWNPEHQWYYAPDMRTNEVLLIKCYDSSMEGVSRFTPHTAFADPNTPPNALPRESIEVRVLAIW